MEAESPASPPVRGSRIGVLVGVAALVLALDAVSKALVVAKLTQDEPVHLLGNVLELILLRNPGAAFNVGTGYTVVFTVLAVGVIAFVVRTARRLKSTGYAVAFGLLLGGAAGNLADRMFRGPGVFRGYVVDWIGVVPRYWPVFNLADSSICIAGALLVLLALVGIHMDGTRGERGELPSVPDAPEARADVEAAQDSGAPSASAPVAPSQAEADR